MIAFVVDSFKLNFKHVFLHFQSYIGNVVPYVGFRVRISGQISKRNIKNKKNISISSQQISGKNSGSKWNCHEKVSQKSAVRSRYKWCEKLGHNPDWRVVMANYVCMYRYVLQIPKFLNHLCFWKYNLWFEGVLKIRKLLTFQSDFTLLKTQENSWFFCLEFMTLLWIEN